jgi:hypothetical protein
LGTLTLAEETELRILHHMEEDERWEKAPFWGPGGSSFKVRPLRPGRGRPPGVQGDLFAEVERAARSWPGSRPPTQAWVAHQLNYGAGLGDKDGARQVRRILKKAGFPTWKDFIDEQRRRATR